MSAKRRRPSLMIPVAALVLAAFANAPLEAQSEAELRRENQRLQAEIRDLQSELAAARVQIEQLLKDAEDLKRQLREAKRARRTAPPTTAPTEEISIDESVASASPRALMRAMRESYAEATKDLEIGAANSRPRRHYELEVRSWVSRVNRELRSPIGWHVRLLETDRANRTYTVKLQAVDPKTDVALGDPFWVRLSRPMVKRLEAGSQQSLETEVLRLRGIVVPTAAFNANRQSSTAFDDYPPLIGPFAEFGFMIEPRSLIPAHEDHEDEEAEEEAEKGKGKERQRR